MEKDAKLHQAADMTSLSPTTAGDIQDVAAVPGLRGTHEQRKKSEPSLSSGTLVHVSCNDGTVTALGVIPVAAEAETTTTTTTTTTAATTTTTTTNTAESPPSHGHDTAGIGQCPEPEDRISNGMENGSVVASGNGQGGTSKLANNRNADLPSTLTDASDVRSAAHVRADTTPGCDPVEQTMTPVKPKHLCPDTSALSPAAVKSPLPAADHTASDGLPGGTSDPDPSFVCESRSLDSLESFSNLNSCPSSELNSECLEERGLALSLQGEYGADETQASCIKDRGGAGQSIYHIKWIRWREESTPVITQNENGPCPLLAIMNVLLLAWKVRSLGDKCR